MTWLHGFRHRSRRELLWMLLVSVGLFGFVALTYVVVVLVGGLLVGRTDAPPLGLSVLATAIVALGFDPMVTRCQRLASWLIAGRRPTPYDALRRFASVVAENRPAEDLTLRMARLLAEGTGAAWAQVWVVVGDRAVPTATWPVEAAVEAAPGPEQRTAPDLPGVRRLPVLHGGEVLGELVLREQPGIPLTPVELRLFTGLAGQAGLVLRGAQLRAALEQRLRELSAREAELRVSRERLVDAQDAARKRLERDIHDGAQQHLVALAVNLRLAATLAVTSPPRAEPLLAAQEEAAADAVATLVQLSRGIYPPLLEEQGVAAALRAVAGESVEVVDLGTGRYPIGVEVAAYFCCLEAIQNAAKHAGATTIRIELRGEPDALAITITDEGVGFDTALTPMGSGLANIRDRVESFGGSLTIDSAPGAGTRIRAVLPARALVASRGEA
jgi:signal transduction histidine kinase